MSAIAFGATAAAPRSHLRLTTRGRVVIGMLVAVPLLAASLVFGLGTTGASAGDQTTADTYSYVNVAPGETLWQLAQQLAPNADPRDVIADIVSLNQLDSTGVQAGQKLAIPTKYTQN